ncbi:hypothetical protein EDB81DRAFT_886932 [Dactylonectria macrodidyma]|uniref:Uncharacterized protein n=1 Tax=Dactylonectria macrodidyma TaxID=307937 RepID=A0A9P9ECN7_9HYPO|nr:hypothetical protein EDB81DRAFT_886932 [Dactylonectria macrodidyma]
MYWAPLAAEAVLLGALLPSVNAAAAPRYEEAREEHVRRFPEPTQDVSGLADKLKSLQGRDVRPRQVQTSDSITYTITMAPDETCGYLSASAGVGITCDNGQNCAWEVKEVDVILCGTQIKDRCFESSVALNSELCNDVCQSNEFNLLCTESDAPYCRTYIYPSGVWDYRCASTPVTAPQSVDFTYDGQDDPGFITTILAETSSIPDSSTVSTESSTTSSEVATSTTAPPEPTHENKKKTPIGAIVGGVIGGVAVIAFIVFGIIFFLRRKKSKTPPAAPAQQQPPANYVPGPTDQYQQQMQQQQQMQMAMGTDQKPVMPTSPVPSDWRHSTMSGPSTAVSPISQQGWTPQPFPNNNTSPAPAPAYEAPGHEAREPTPVYEMGDDSGAKK